MDNIELFDKYIAGKLSQNETVYFEERLTSDSAFASEFRLHLHIVRGIQKEEEEDCIEFGHAMKSLSKEELNEIIGKKRKTIYLKPNLDKPIAAAFTKDGSDNNKNERGRFSLNYQWLLSVAAVVVLAFIVNHNQSVESQYAIDNILYSYNEPMFSNRGGDAIDISGYNEDELKEVLPILQSVYDNSETAQEALVNGKGLAMVYIKLHDRDKAREILEELIYKYEKMYAQPQKDEYAESIEECKKILNQISE